MSASSIPSKGSPNLTSISLPISEIINKTLKHTQEVAHKSLDAARALSSTLSDNRVISPSSCLSEEDLAKLLDTWVMDPSQLKGEKRQEAKKRILECYKTKSAILSLACLHLSTLPKEITFLSVITTLAISHNRLRELPEGFEALAKLQVIRMGFNQLSVIPPVIFKLCNLQILDIAHNCITYISKGLENLSNLIEFNASINKIKIVEPEMGKLSQLEHLFLSKNLLEALPPTIVDLPLLQELDVSHNKITALPVEIGRLSQLTNINVDSNSLTHLPDTLAACPVLETLSFFNNPFTPSFLSHFDAKLCELEASGVKISKSEKGLCFERTLHCETLMISKFVASSSFAKRFKREQSSSQADSFNGFFSGEESP